jgi:hypothetical protein
MEELTMTDFQRFLAKKGKLHNNTNFYSHATEQQLENLTNNRAVVINW